MARTRGAVVISILKGLGAAIAVTLALMLLLALAVVYLGSSDRAIGILNQIIKLAAVVTGTRFAVGIGGEKGFHLGFVTALIYMSLGYFLYLQLGGATFSGVAMMGEILLGGAAGAAAGGAFANMRPTRRGARA